MRPAIDSGNVTGDAPVSYWPILFSLSLVAIPKVFANLTRLGFLLGSKVAGGC